MPLIVGKVGASFRDPNGYIVRSFIESALKAIPIRTIFSSVRPWAKTCWCAKFCQNPRLNTRKWDRQANRKPYIDLESDRQLIGIIKGGSISNPPGSYLRSHNFNILLYYKRSRIWTLEVFVRTLILKMGRIGLMTRLEYYIN